MNTSLTLYQLSYQEIWWVEPRNFKVHIFVTKFNHLYLGTGCVRGFFLGGKGGGDTP